MGRCFPLEMVLRSAAGKRRRARWFPTEVPPKTFRMPVIELDRARGSRIGQRPLSTCWMKSPTRRLNSSGSSRLIACPQFGITASAARRDGPLHQDAGLEAGPVLVAVEIRVGTSSVSSARPGRRATAARAARRAACSPRPSAECSRQHRLELGEAARVLVLVLHPGRAVGVFLGETRHAGRRSPAAIASASARNRSRSSGSAP